MVVKVVILVVMALVVVVVIVVILVVIALVAVVVMVILVVIALVLVVVIVAVLAGVVSYFVVLPQYLWLPWNRSTATGPHSQCEYKYINMYSITEFVYAYIEYVKDSRRKRDRES